MDLALLLQSVTFLDVIFQFCFAEGSSISSHSCGEDLHCNIVDDEYCCRFPDFHCCDYAAFVKSFDGNIPEDSNGDDFGKTGLRMTLVLLILSSGMFLFCFCVMKCCKQHSTRPRHHESTLADYRRRNARIFSRLSRHSRSRHSHSHSPTIINLTISTRSEVTDEPPTYNEVITSDVSCNSPTGKPPEYSTLVSHQSEVD